jgi:hypothetical protein
MVFGSLKRTIFCKGLSHRWWGSFEQVSSNACLQLNHNQKCDVKGHMLVIWLHFRLMRFLAHATLGLWYVLGIFKCVSASQYLKRVFCRTYMRCQGACRILSATRLDFSNAFSSTSLYCAWIHRYVHGCLLFSVDIRIHEELHAILVKLHAICFACNLFLDGFSARLLSKLLEQLELHVHVSKPLINSKRFSKNCGCDKYDFDESIEAGSHWYSLWSHLFILREFSDIF